MQLKLPNSLSTDDNQRGISDISYQLQQNPYPSYSGDPACRLDMITVKN